MLEAGVLGREEKLELIEGELYVLSPKHNRHEKIKLGLVRFFAKKLSEDIQLGVETTLYFDDDTFVEPDLHMFPINVPTDKVKGPDVLLAIEVSDSTLGYDLKRKPPVYARFGVAELWVIDAQNGITHIHTDPEPDGYAKIEIRNADETLVAPFDSAIALRLADLIK